MSVSPPIDEDSFVILGTSPTPSMDLLSLSQINSMMTNRKQQQEPPTSLERSAVVSIAGDKDSLHSIHESLQKLQLKSITVATGAAAGKPNSLSLSSQNTTRSIANMSASVRFPSLIANAMSVSNNQEVIRLQKMIDEHDQLKNGFENANKFMREHFRLVKEWTNTFCEYKETREKQIVELNDEIQKLQEEKDKQLKDMTESRNLLALKEAQLEEENEMLTRRLSEQTAIMRNMSARLETLETNNLTMKKRSPTPQSKSYTDRSDPEDTVTLFEHKRTIKDMLEKISVLKAHNLEFEDMKKTYIDELDCLRVNLTSCEELLVRSHAENMELKATIENHSQLDEVYKVQLDTYRTDFETERQEREKLAGAKDELIEMVETLMQRNRRLNNELTKTGRSEID